VARVFTCSGIGPFVTFGVYWTIVVLLKCLLVGFLR
jgi:hypothetical protein